MSKTISIDLRRRVAAFVDDGHSGRAAARHFCVSESFAIKLIQRRKATGSIKPAQQGRAPGSGKLAPFRRYLLGLVTIEMALSKLKAHLRKAKARTYDALWKVIGHITNEILKKIHAISKCVIVRRFIPCAEYGIAAAREFEFYIKVPR